MLLILCRCLQCQGPCSRHGQEECSSGETRDEPSQGQRGQRLIPGGVGLPLWRSPHICGLRRTRRVQRHSVDLEEVHQSSWYVTQGGDPRYLLTFCPVLTAQRNTVQAYQLLCSHPSLLIVSLHIDMCISENEKFFRALTAFLLPSPLSLGPTPFPSLAVQFDARISVKTPAKPIRNSQKTQ